MHGERTKVSWEGLRLLDTATSSMSRNYSAVREKEGTLKIVAGSMVGEQKGKKDPFSRI